MLNVYGEEAVQQKVYVSPNSVFRAQNETLESGLTLLRTLYGLIESNELDAVTPRDLSCSLRVAEELILIGVQPLLKR